MKPPLTIVCCSVLRREAEEVLRPDYPGAEMIFPDSMLHMHPDKLHTTMEDILVSRTDRLCLLIYGDCHAHMRELESRPLCARTDCVNCGELLLGRETYQRYRDEKVFFFLPEWVHRWREVFQQELGFADGVLAQEFMQENHKSLAYLDTGLLPVPEKIIVEISDFFGMSVDTVQVSLDNLSNAVRTAIEGLGSHTDR